ncbi:MAG: MBL fold metallo-hydrolase [Rhodocyclaceae bacterium]|nr:MBL fold metallo-hydrolase [Rhodocyclaceae bacterium]
MPRGGGLMRSVRIWRCLAGWLGACLAATSLDALAAEYPAAPTRLAPGVYARGAPPGPPSPANRGRTNSTGILVGSTGVVVVDPGPSRAEGLRLLRAIRRLTPKPVVAVVLTHAHPENVLAADTVAGRSAVVVAQARTYALMRDRCSECLQRLIGLAGQPAMVGTNIRLPDQTVGDGVTERVWGGRRVRLVATGWGHTAGDLVVFDVASGTLFAGGLVNREVMPDMHEARIRGWLAALDTLSALSPRRVVSGERVAGKRAAVASGRAEYRGDDIRLIGMTRDYLADLLARVEATYRQQGSVFEVLADGELPRYAGWVRYGEAQPLNIQHVYAELEKEDFATR